MSALSILRKHALFRDPLHRIPSLTNMRRVLLDILLFVVLWVGIRILSDYPYPSLFPSIPSQWVVCPVLYSDSDLSVHLEESPSSEVEPLKAKISEMIHIEKEMFVKVMKTATPVICNEGLWAISNAIVFAIYGQISAAALAIVQIANTVTEVFQTLYAGMSNASSVIIGKTLGRGEKDLAYKYSIKMMKLTFVFNIFTMTLLIIAIWPIAGIYGFEPETTDMLIKSLLVFAAAQLPKMLVYVLVCGIIRAGGDTVWCLKMEFLFNFCCQIGLALIAVNILGLPLYLSIAVVMLAEVTKSIV